VTARRFDDYAASFAVRAVAVRRELKKFGGSSIDAGSMIGVSSIWLRIRPIWNSEDLTATSLTLPSLGANNSRQSPPRACLQPRASSRYTLEKTPTGC
jgi:hypothetical protein